MNGDLFMFLRKKQLEVTCKVGGGGSDTMVPFDVTFCQQVPHMTVFLHYDIIHSNHNMFHVLGL